eukprot:5018959-Amphidinium_carterae.1
MDLTENEEDEDLLEACDAQPPTQIEPSELGATLGLKREGDVEDHRKASRPRKTPTYSSESNAILDAIAGMNRSLSSQMMSLQTEIRGKQQQQQQQMDNLEQRFGNFEDRVAERFAALESKLHTQSIPAQEEGVVGILGGWEKDTKSAVIEKWIQTHLVDELQNTVEWFVPPPKSKVAIVRFRTKSDLYECMRRIRPKANLHPSGKLYLFQSQPEEVREERNRLSGMMKRLREHLPTN